MYGIFSSQKGHSTPQKVHFNSLKLSPDSFSLFIPAMFLTSYYLFSIQRLTKEAYPEKP